MTDAQGGAFGVTQSWAGRIAVLTVCGAVDMLTAPALAEAIEAAARRQPCALIVDLSAVDFLASAGIGELVFAHDHLAPRMRFAVVADGPVTSRPMRLVGVDQLVPLHRTLEDALHGARARPCGADDRR